jgi:alpha-glucoside transport system permease protein
MPTLGIFVSSFRDKDQLTASGWWTAFSSSERNEAGRPAVSIMKQEGPLYVISGNVLEGKEVLSTPTAPRPSRRAPTRRARADLGDGIKLTINSDGAYRYTSTAPFTDDNTGRRVYLAVATPPASRWSTIATF